MDHQTVPAESDRVRELAHSLDCLTEGDLLELGGYTQGTLQSKRKRGTGPEYILFGNNYLYPRKSFALYLESQVRERKSLAKGML